MAEEHGGPAAAARPRYSLEVQPEEGQGQGTGAACGTGGHPMVRQAAPPELRQGGKDNSRDVLLVNTNSLHYRTNERIMNIPD
eukprot:1014958-Prorocentrum_minimum.AAC.1